MTKIKKSKKGKNNVFPFVSICTPTFNRRPFIPALINCVKNQNYPLNRIEWIIIDDGTDPIEDLVKDIKEVKYFQGGPSMSYCIQYFSEFTRSCLKVWFISS